MHLDPLSPEERALWDSFAAAVAAAGPSETIVTKSRVARRLWTHRLRLERPEDIDENLAAWLRASWETYSRPPEAR